MIWGLTNVIRGMGHLFAEFLFGLIRLVTFPFFLREMPCEALAAGVGGGALAGRLPGAARLDPVRMAWQRFSWPSSLSSAVRPEGIGVVGVEHCAHAGTAFGGGSMSSGVQPTTRQAVDDGG